MKEESQTEIEVRKIVEAGDRNSIIKAIKRALEKRSGKKWSVTGGRGTSWGWIHIDAPPLRKTARHQLKAGATSDRPEDYEEIVTNEPGGSMTPSDRAELKALLGLDRGISGSEGIPASSDYRREYLHRAMFGNPGSFTAQPYWD